ncbi:hypothetical protein OROMI_016209 [Orobanche minor]
MKRKGDGPRPQAVVRPVGGWFWISGKFDFNVVSMNCVHDLALVSDFNRVLHSGLSSWISRSYFGGLNTVGRLKGRLMGSCSRVRAVSSENLSQVHCEGCIIGLGFEFGLKLDEKDEKKIGSEIPLLE